MSENVFEGKQTITAAVAFRFVSNEDEIGIFFQGLLCGLILVYGEEVRLTSPARMLEDANEEEVTRTALGIFNMFLESKRTTEMMRIHEPPFLNALRTRAIKDALKLVSNIEKEDEQ